MFGHAYRGYMDIQRYFEIIRQLEIHEDTGVIVAALRIRLLDEREFVTSENSSRASPR